MAPVLHRRKHLALVRGSYDALIYMILGVPLAKTSDSLSLTAYEGD